MGNCVMFGLEPRFLAQSRQFREPASVKLFGFGGGSVRIRTSEIIGVNLGKCGYHGNRMEIYGNITNDDLVSDLKYDLTFVVFCCVHPNWEENKHIRLGGVETTKAM